MRLQIIFHPVSRFRKLNEVGIHRLFENEHDIFYSIEQADKDSFETIHLYTSTPSVNIFKPYFEHLGYEVFDSETFPGIGIIIESL